jgi:hypothetical protein
LDRATLARPGWQNDQADQGAVTENNWAGVTIKWDGRGERQILHSDMAQVERVPKNQSDFVPMTAVANSKR